MAEEQFENLIFALIQGRLGWVNLPSGHSVREDFQAIFYFKVGQKVWFPIFRIKTSKHGTPKLETVSVYGCMDLPIDLLEKGGKHELLTEEENRRFMWDDGVIVGPNREGVERWQLKFVEQNRFRLFELAMVAAVEKDLRFSNSNALDKSELKSLQKQIAKRIRQKIGPEFLLEVAKIYESAALNNENPIPALMEVYKCSHRRAQEYATLARRAHFLPPTERRVVTINPAKEKRTRNE